VRFSDLNNVDVTASKMIQYYHRNLMDNAGHFILNTGEILPVGYGQAVAEYNMPKKNIGCCGGAALYNFKMIEKIGFFDPFFQNGYEDAEFGYRAFLEGYKCMYCPEAIVYHKGGASIKKVFNEEYAIKTQEDILYTYLKLNPMSYKVLNFPFICLRYIILLLGLVLICKIKYARILFRAILRIIKKRRSISYSYHSKISLWKIISQQQFFIWFDIKRFFKTVFLRQDNALDSY